MKQQRVEQYLIKRGHPKYRVIDEMCFYSKQIYNMATYIIKEEFKKTGKYIPYKEMNYNMKSHEFYKTCMSQPANCCLRRIDKTWKSYFEGLKKYNSTNGKGFLGKPHPPKFLKYNGRYVWEIPNNSCHVNPNDNHELCFRIRKLQDVKWYINNKYNGRLLQVRFVPKGTCYVMETVYEVEVEVVQNLLEPKNIISIDCGVNNFATITNNIGLEPIIINGKRIKSINQYYNKQRAYYYSILTRRNKHKDILWSKRLDILTNKRCQRTKNYIHNVTAYIIKYCKYNDIDTIVVGHNKEWKQEKNRMQNFVWIPFDMLILQLKYKCIDNNINLVVTEESYTSGTSFLDNEQPTKEYYNKERRIVRGLFKSNNGTLINSDVNGSLQIMKKVFPNAFDGVIERYGIEVYLTPIVVNVI